MGKYAKAIVSEAQIVGTLAKPYEKMINSDILQFVAVAHKVYYAISIWSLIHVYHAKIKAEKFEHGENFTKLAGVCIGFVDRIGSLHRELLGIPKIKESKYYETIEFYFGKIMIAKSSE